jgi:hypothetical protein
VSIWPRGIRRIGRKPNQRKEQIMKFLGYTLGDPNAPMAPPTPEMMAEMGKYVEEATKAGVLLATGGVGPLSEAVKVQYHDGEFTVLDGPFTEAKELVGGWALMECRDQAEAVEWTKRFLALAGPGEATVRTVYG